jgi:hypothetical protein
MPDVIMRVPPRRNRRPPRNPGVWLTHAVIELLLGLFFAFGLAGMVPSTIGAGFGSPRVDQP